MDEVWIQILVGVVVGVVVTIIIGGLTFFGKWWLDLDNDVLPSGSRREDRVDYSHLSGKWYLYYLTRYPHLHPSPIWIHAVQELKITKNKVEGSTRMVDHPSAELSYRVHGEVRQGRMILTDYCIQDEIEFASVIIPHLLKADLVGVWTGFDGQDHLIAAPVIMSKVARSVNELNGILNASTMSLVPRTETFASIYQGGKVVTEPVTTPNQMQKS